MALPKTLWGLLSLLLKPHDLPLLPPSLFAGVLHTQVFADPQMVWVSAQLTACALQFPLSGTL